MPFQKLPDQDLTYALISFDENGNERTDDQSGGGMFSQAILTKAAADKPSHVFLYSHGWKGDFDSAVDQYNRWIGAMWRLDADKAAMGAGFRPMFIGLHWPSEPWGNENLSTASPSGGGGSSFSTSAMAAQPAHAPDVPAMFAEAVAHFGEKPEIRSALKVIFDAYAAKPGAITIPEEALAAYHNLARAIGFSANGGPGAAPDLEGAPLDPQKAVNAYRLTEAGANFGIFDTIKKGILGGLGQLSFWLMKKPTSPS